MKKNIDLSDEFIDFRLRTIWTPNFQAKYQLDEDKVYEVEHIRARFSYNVLSMRRAQDEDQWDNFKSFIAKDFDQLDLPPCHLYVSRKELLAMWFIPEQLVVKGFESQQQKILLENIVEDLTKLNQCSLKEITISGGQWSLKQEEYLLRIYRVNQFIKKMQ
ncbi:hypothetical protein [Bacillus sp. Au-Bac7]|uniref:hypothetical protein n=1 Tax=Bacillus sp. Au-Bac7 TaxID=2906458 RepID=UPI001E58DB74|nr:hypothetical protein [Bacillus sp. Au-Bac7]MCE4049912.1 hypothetical protein [Bacillus sp. Au-Bac7]